MRIYPVGPTAEIGFVLLSALAGPIHYTPLSINDLPLLVLRRDWLCFARFTSTPATLAALPAHVCPCPSGGNWLCFARSARVGHPVRPSGELASFGRIVLGGPSGTAVGRIGFVSPNVFRGSIPHNSCSPQRLPLIAAPTELALFCTIDTPAKASLPSYRSVSVSVRPGAIGFVLHGWGQRRPRLPVGELALFCTISPCGPSCAAVGKIGFVSHSVPVQASRVPASASGRQEPTLHPPQPV